MLQKFTLSNFKSYRRATLDFSTLTLLIGANASGKSNALEALQMLSWLARGRRLDDVFRAVQESELLIRGTVSDLTSTGAESFELGCVLDMDGQDRNLAAEIVVGKDGMSIKQESISSPREDVPLYRVAQAGSDYSHDLLVSYNNFARGRNKPQITCTNQQAVFTQLLTPARFADKDERSQREIPDATKAFIEALTSILFLDPNPRRMRNSSFIVDRSLRGDGSNISSTLFDLCQVRGAKQRVLDFIRDLPEQDITDIGFLETPRKEVMVTLTETFGLASRPREAAILSDGTLRVLAVAAALLSAPKGATVVIEEIDNGVHPSRARTLLANIERIARDQQLNILLTSHNPALLDALPIGAIPDVVFCYRHPTEGDSRLVKLSELTNYPELVAQGPLGRLVTRGVLDRFVKNAKSPEEKQQAAFAWIDELEKSSAPP